MPELIEILKYEQNKKEELSAVAKEAALALAAKEEELRVKLEQLSKISGKEQLQWEEQNQKLLETLRSAAQDKMAATLRKMEQNKKKHFEEAVDLVLQDIIV